MILSWPEDLPRPERSSWSAAPQEARRKRQSETGPPGYRRRFSSAARLVSLSVVLDRQEKAIFDDFFEIDTQHGAALFWMPDPTTDGWAVLDGIRAPLLTDAGAPLLLAAQWLCTFGDQLPTETIQGTEFRIAFSVAVMP